MQKTVRNSIAKNIVHLFYSTALSSALNAAALICLAYYLQSHHYGMFSVALASVMIMGYFTDAGLSEIVLREGSKREADVSIIMSSYIKVRAVLLTGTFLFGFILLHLLHSDDQELMRTAYYLSIPMVTGLALQSIGTTFFQLIEKMQYCGMIRMVSAVLLVLNILAGMLFSLNPFVVCFLYGFSYFLSGLIGLYLVRRNISLTLKGRFHRGLLEKLSSFAIGGLLFVILPHLGPLVLEKTLTFKEVGFFAVAYRIPQALQQIPFIVAGAYCPVLFRYYNNNQLEDHLQLNISLIKIMSLVGMAMTIPFYYMSETIITLLFGEGWIRASELLKILSILLTLQAFNIALADGLTTRAMQAHRTAVQCIAVVSGIILYFTLSARFGITGAAYAGIFIECITFLGFIMFIPNRWKIFKKAAGPYLLFFTVSLLCIDYFFYSLSFLAVSLHFLLLITLIIMDKEVSGKMKNYIRSSKYYQKWRVRRAKGAEDGL
ncbi:oligosaccharide flippase family protein [Metabacillus fastidiosus]|uniref:Oligosaccharide flippase family protein n=1 Tax=Metabacillus fastidiosus TaxID=1458 RepID=A0ABU6NYR8_9BACI|nr:oligosaccharide flippase family protein [Metabacillus fastidiosus]MED4401394.1 oligosaccharide flippase family protein [Metabacillus fastidiosus]